MAYFEGMNDAPPVVLVHDLVVCGVHLRQLIAQGIQSFCLKTLCHGKPYVVGNGWYVVDSVAYSIDIHHATAGDEGSLTVAKEELEKREDIIFEHRGTVIVGEMERSDEVMPCSCLLFLGRRRRSDGQFGIYLSGVGVYYRHIEMLGDGQCEFRFADSGRPEQYYQCLRSGQMAI